MEAKLGTRGYHNNSMFFNLTSTKFTPFKELSKFLWLRYLFQNLTFKWLSCSKVAKMSLKLTRLSPHDMLIKHELFYYLKKQFFHRVFYFFILSCQDSLKLPSIGLRLRKIFSIHPVTE